MPPTAGPDEPPCVQVEKQGGGMRIAALDPAALRVGLGIGLSLADARARLPTLRVTRISRRADAACLRACATTCERFTPLVALDGPDGLLLDITGCAHLFGGEETLRATVHQRFARHGLHGRITIAGTPEAAHAFARFSAEGVVSPGTEATQARSLPVTALDSPVATTLALTRAGLVTLGQLADRPPAILTARFGEEPVTALRRILGQEHIRLSPLRAVPDCTAEAHFAEPLTQIPSLLAILGDLTRDIADQLHRRGLGGRAFEASFFRADGAVRRLAVETARGTRDSASLARLFALRIETLADPIDPGFGFDALRLAVLRSEPLLPAQRRLDGQAPDPAADEAALAELIDRLVVRFGSAQVRRFIARDSHDPIRASGTAPCLAPPPATLPAGLSTAAAADTPPTRPLTLFDPPQPIETLAEVPDGPPRRFRWRRAAHEIIRAEGPERIAPEWWRPDNQTAGIRDYYRLEDTNGQRFWVFREDPSEACPAPPRWFLHGLFA